MWLLGAEIKSQRPEVKADLEPSDPTPHLRDEDSAIERGSDLSRSMCEEPTGFRERPTEMTAVHPKTTEAMSPQALLNM